MKRLTDSMKLVLTVAALWALPCLAQVSTFVTVTDHSEEALNWCGAATGQMVVSGYPGGPCVQVQADVWDAIQAAKVETSWDTDPAGLKAAMTTLCPLPPGGVWSIHADPSAPAIMHAAAKWMKLRHYPVAAVLNTNPHNSLTTHHEHWVTITGIVTDIDPTTNPSVTLQWVLISDQPASFGDPVVDRFLSGAQWYSEFQAVVNPASAYNGKFVALIEPPQVRGTAKAPTLRRSGAVISAARALAAAKNAVRSDALRRVEAFREIGQMEPGEPILVNSPRGDYYIVPYAKPGYDPSMAVLINAYDGVLLEAGRFAPRRWLSEKEAVDLALGVLKRPDRGAPKARRVLSERDSPYFPAWRVSVDGAEVVVQNNGQARRD